MTHQGFSAIAIIAGVCLSGTATLAQNLPMYGDFSIHAGQLDINSSGTSVSGKALTGAAGRVVVGISPNVSAQFDVGGESVKVGGWIGDYTVSDFAGHLTYNAGSSRIGGMLSVGRTDAWPYTPNATLHTFAIEGAHVAGNVELTGQIGRTEMSNNGDLAARYVRVEGRIPVTQNITAGFNVGGGKIDYDSGDRVDFTTWGLDAEYQPGQKPYSLFLSYQGSKQTEPSESEEWTNSVITVGVRVQFGGSGHKPVFANYNPLSGVQHLRAGDWE